MATAAKRVATQKALSLRSFPGEPKLREDDAYLSLQLEMRQQRGLTRDTRYQVHSIVIANSRLENAESPAAMLQENNP